MLPSFFIESLPVDGKQKKRSLPEKEETYDFYLSKRDKKLFIRFTASRSWSIEEAYEQRI